MWSGGLRGFLDCEQVWVLSQHPPLELLQRGRGIDPEPVDQRAARGLVGLERLRLPTRAIQGDHELAAQALAQRVGGDVGLQLCHEVGTAAELEISRKALLGRREAQLVESRSLVADEVLVGEVGKCRPAPQRERPGQRLGAFRRCELRGSANRILEPHGVDRRRLDDEDVPGRPGDDHLRAECLSQLGNGVLKRPSCGAWWALAPDRADEPVDRDDLTRTQQERGEEHPLPASWKRSSPGRIAKLERTQDAELHEAFVTGCTR